MKPGRLLWWKQRGPGCKIGWGQCVSGDRVQQGSTEVHNWCRSAGFKIVPQRVSASWGGRAGVVVVG
jgi:hypothetical protein